MPALTEGDAKDGVALKGRKYARRGLDRVVSPEDTLARALPLAASMGITRIANITGLDRLGVPTVAVTRPNSRSVSVSLGKGATLSAAKASGLMEAIEGFHAEQVDAPVLFASYERMMGRANVVDVSRLARVHGGSFDAGSKLLWLEGHDLVQDAPCFVPFETVHTDYTLPLPAGSGAFLMSSNGLASGNQYLEAVSHGICEVVERDANSLWRCRSAEAQARTRLDLSSVDDDCCLEVLEWFRSAGIDACVWETTSDVGIPCFRCQITDSANSGYHPIHPVSGFGCHPRREIALLRALTEAAQGRLVLISGARDDLSRNLFHDEDAVRKAREFDALRTAPGVHRHFYDTPSYDSATLDGDVTWELAQLAGAGLDAVVVVDLEKAEFGIPVVRVIVPGLESICEAPNYVPGIRLRRVLEGTA